MGYTIYYRIKIDNHEKALSFIERVCRGLGMECELEGGGIRIICPSGGVEPLIIKNGEGFVKTYGREPCTSLYLLLLLSLSAFGSVEVFDDS
ncbi:hypothetical protein DRN43_04390 [Thermococci archaeon]|nr:MAG: hypothetical protein DRN39_08530 [Thermococci archaeon]RLF89125.1 MAG: hypothetical protein DRN43_04390 [Thermococci archaeon]